MEITVKDVESGEVFRTQPARDVAFFMPRLVAEVEARLGSSRLEPATKARLEKAGAGPDDLRRAVACFMIYMDLAREPQLTSPFEAITASGFLDQHREAQRVVLEAFAMTCLGAFWAGIRSSVMEDECPPLLSNLRRRGAELLAELSGSPEHNAQSDT